MDIDKLKEFGLGIFVIRWKESAGGGTSVAAIGYVENDDRWIAPSNWLAPLMPNSPNYREHVDNIEWLIRIDENEVEQLKKRGRELEKCIREVGGANFYPDEQGGYIMFNDKMWRPVTAN
jgi:hypothetical protein